MKKVLHTTPGANLMLLIIFACFACTKEKVLAIPSITNTASIDTSRGGNNSAKTDLSYLALGDSYTIGQSVAENDRFPAQTVELLKSKNITVKSTTYIATTGWTTGNLINAINAQNPDHNYDIVTLLIGVNDQYQHVDIDTYRNHFTALLNTAVTLAGNRPSRVFVISIPDYSATPFVGQQDKARVSKEIDDFNAANKDITLSNKIAYIDITTGSREAATNSTLIAGDGLHPSGKEYAKWAALLTPVIQAALK